MNTLYPHHPVVGQQSHPWSMAGMHDCVGVRFAVVSGLFCYNTCDGTRRLLCQDLGRRRQWTRVVMPTCLNTVYQPDIDGDCERIAQCSIPNKKQKRPLRQDFRFYKRCVPHYYFVQLLSGFFFVVITSVAFLQPHCVSCWLACAVDVTAQTTADSCYRTPQPNGSNIMAGWCVCV